VDNGPFDMSLTPAGMATGVITRVPIVVEDFVRGELFIRRSGWRVIFKVSPRNRKEKRCGLIATEYCYSFLCDDTPDEQLYLTGITRWLILRDN
jgi:hypothetical protein